MEDNDTQRQPNNTEWKDELKNNSKWKDCPAQNNEWKVNQLQQKYMMTEAIMNNSISITSDR